MSELTDAVVVGGGLNGATTAFLLRQAGLAKVVLLERGAPPSDSQAPHGASPDGAGLLRVHYDNGPETALAAVSMPYFARWQEWCGGDAGWRRTGFLRFVDDAEVDRLRVNTERQVALGARASVLDPEQIGALSSRFDLTDLGAAVYEPDSGTADNELCTRSMLAAAERAGVDVRFGATVTALETDADGIRAVRVGDTSISTRTVVLAAGPGARSLAAGVGVEIPLVARALTMARIAPTTPTDDLISYMDPISNSWLSPRASGDAVISVGDEGNGAVVDPDDYSREVEHRLIVIGLERVAQRVPSLADAPIVGAWRGVDSFAPDGKPILGPVPDVPGLYLNVGAAGKGHKVAPAVGIALAELIGKGACETVDIAPFALSRFDQGGFARSGTEYDRAAIG